MPRFAESPVSWRRRWRALAFMLLCVAAGLPHIITPNNAVRATFVTCICAALAVLLYRADRRPTGNATAEETQARLVPEPARGA